jgi:hypothetical protein
MLRSLHVWRSTALVQTGRKLALLTGMHFAPGQQVVWIYQPHIAGGGRHCVDAEVVHVGRLRIRIRIRTSTGPTLLRWVKPHNLRLKTPDEPLYSYPHE